MELTNTIRENMNIVPADIQRLICDQVRIMFEYEEEIKKVTKLINVNVFIRNTYYNKNTKDYILSKVKKHCKYFCLDSYEDIENTIIKKSTYYRMCAVGTGWNNH